MNNSQNMQMVCGYSSRNIIGQIMSYFVSAKVQKIKDLLDKFHYNEASGKREDILLS